MTDEPIGRYPTAVEREKAKIAGIDAHPAEKHQDPLGAKLAELSDEQPKKARLKHLGGSDFDRFNSQIAQSAVETAWITSADAKAKAEDLAAYGLGGIAPRDEVEGMLGAQMIAAHQSSMECYRRSMNPQQSSDVRALNLKNAAKASQTYAALLETLNRHRAKGQQRVVVEHRHVHVYPGGQQPGGRGDHLENERQPHAPAIDHQPQFGAEVRSEDAQREPVLRPGDAERSMPHARRRQPGRSDG